MNPEITERVREMADRNAGPDDVLDFYSTALSIGLSEAQAEQIDEILTIRVMRTRGGI